MRNPIFDDIRPYYDEEINLAMGRIILDPNFKKIIQHLFPEKDFEKYIEEIKDISSSYEFQAQIMHPVIIEILRRSSSDLSFSGLEHLKKGEANLFISNHRDILLDSAILQLVLYDNQIDTTEITFGSNLMISQFVIDIGKTNRMYKVLRGGNMKEFIKNSSHLSEYIRYSIKDKKVSSWIAQRNGRTKNGDDRTDPGLLKMLNMSGKKDFFQNFEELNISPMSISYEYEPCDFLKVNEIYQSKVGPYVKKPNEDLNSIITGIVQPKGRIHLSICKPLNDQLARISGESNNNERIKNLAHLIDIEIYKNYKLFPTNYIAFDILNKTKKFTESYTDKEKEGFIKYMYGQLQKIEGEKDQLEPIFLNLYANPVKNTFIN